MELHVRRILLPGRELVELWTDHGRISRGPVPGTRRIAGDGFVLPAQVVPGGRLAGPEPR